jgi:hypothetical protein
MLSNLAILAGWGLVRLVYLEVHDYRLNWEHTQTTDIFRGECGDVSAIYYKPCEYYSNLYGFA